MTATPQLDVGKALGTDYFLLRSELTKEETDYLDRTRRFVEDEVLPVMPGRVRADRARPRVRLGFARDDGAPREG
jgi:hypothetical protein